MDCPICKRDWASGIITGVLDCGHLICVDCCERLYEDFQQIPCPQCRKKTDKPPGELPTSLTINRMVQISNRARSECALEIPVVQTDQISIFIVNLSGRNIAYTLKRDTPVFSLKEKIQESEGIPIPDQRLIYMGKQIQDGGNLLDYNVKNNSTIHLAMRLKG